MSVQTKVKSTPKVSTSKTLALLVGGGGYLQAEHHIAIQRHKPPATRPTPPRTRTLIREQRPPCYTSGVRVSRSHIVLRPRRRTQIFNSNHKKRGPLCISRNVQQPSSSAPSGLSSA